MKSRITIEVDFDSGNQPVIQIIQKESDDVRDKLLKSFLESLGGTSSWCRVFWTHDMFQPERYSRIFITPVKPDKLGEQAAIMQEQHILNEKFNATNPKINLETE